ncbi:hypothetical protein M8818_000720 [Zalaria obscura]|uniref:Uncharacterized protein n=1 Tax=Zalaria obscura TaxID=2024903 RepID=A0ACC3SML6_9PEZI
MRGVPTWERSLNRTPRLSCSGPSAYEWALVTLLVEAEDEATGYGTIYAGQKAGSRPWTCEIKAENEAVGYGTLYSEPPRSVQGCDLFLVTLSCVDA